MGGVNFDYLPQRGGSEKLKKGGGSIVQGQVFLKEGGWHCSYLMLSRFIIFTFTNYFTLYKIVMHLQVILIICIILKLLLFFSCHHNFIKKGNSKLSKNEPESIPEIKITYL